MSHFSVAVFTTDAQTVDEMLDQYDESREVEEYISHTKEEMIELARARKEKYEKGIKEGTSDKNDAFVKKYLDANTDEELYQCACYEDKEYDEDGNMLSTYNPNSKWDWYTIGGRWGQFLHLKNGTSEDEACVKDIDFSIDKTSDRYLKAKRFYEVYVDKSPLKEDETEESVLGFPFCKEQYYKDVYHDADTYAKCMTQFSTFAVITPDGEWHEQGEMGWFGCSSDTPEETLDWELHYKERFIDTANPNWTLTIVDCHI